jgi:hypothetical protein
MIPLPTPNDYAAMEAEPIKAEPAKRKRRWFQFRLRTWFVVMTILAVQCAVCLPPFRNWQRRHRVIEVHWNVSESRAVDALQLGLAREKAIQFRTSVSIVENERDPPAATP